MSVSKEEKRWIVVGIALNKVALPVLRDAVKQGMDTHYVQLDNHCQSLAPSCTLQSITLGFVNSHRSMFRNLKFENINDNENSHGKSRRNYNYAINDSIDLAKLYLPAYLAQFSAFNESLDMAAILRLLGSNNYVPTAVFRSDTQNSADDVRENVRNKWGHFNETEWTDTFFHDCFDKMKTLVKSLKLTADVEKNTMAQFAEWQTKGKFSQPRLHDKNCRYNWKCLGCILSLFMMKTLCQMQLVVQSTHSIPHESTPPRNGYMAKIGPV